MTLIPLWLRVRARTRPLGHSSGEAKKARWCAAHKPEEAWNVVSKRCEAAGCTKQPYFGVEPKAARWCATHAPEEAWNVVSKRCEAVGCTKHPHFGLRDERKRRWCSCHAPMEAMNLAPGPAKRKK